MSATSGMMIEFGMPIEGREMKALEEFMTSMAYWAGLKQGGKISEFRSYGTMTGGFNDRSAFVILEGTDQQIHDLRMSEEFRTRINRILTIGHNVHVTLLEFGDAMATRMQRYGATLKSALG